MGRLPSMYLFSRDAVDAHGLRANKFQKSQDLPKGGRELSVFVVSSFVESIRKVPE